MKTFFALLLILVFSNAFLHAQNLIQNPGCDDTLVDGNIPHWQEITGNTWTQRCTSPDAYGGTCYFFPGAVAIGELGQVITISNDSAEIDNGTKIYYFTGFVRAYAQTPSDESIILICFLNANDTILSSYTFGPHRQTETWLRIDSALTAPPGAKKLDFRLHSVRHNGSNNDGYYDELYLGNSPLVGMPEAPIHFTLTTYPNPSTGQFTIEFYLQQPAKVNLVVHTHLGLVVATLADGELASGTHQVFWNSGNLPAGIYYGWLQAGDKMVSGMIIKIE